MLFFAQMLVIKSHKLLLDIISSIMLFILDSIEMKLVKYSTLSFANVSMNGSFTIALLCIQTRNKLLFATSLCESEKLRPVNILKDCFVRTKTYLFNYFNGF